MYIQLWLYDMHAWPLMINTNVHLINVYLHILQCNIHGNIHSCYTYIKNEKLILSPSWYTSVIYVLVVTIDSCKVVLLKILVDNTFLGNILIRFVWHHRCIMHTTFWATMIELLRNVYLLMKICITLLLVHQLCKIS